uniref:ZC3H15/TMA46 family C-terminal domain-containing protein n=1 Tax=Lotharella oceanica TaxID=641309 RepID=A0A7S2TI48_9EUKA
MAKKKGGGASNKNIKKVKDKIIADKTFGLKNKKKSKKVQRFVSQVKKSVNDRMSKKYGKSGGGDGMYLTYEAKQARKQKEQEAKMMADITTFAKKEKKAPEKKPLEDVPPEFIKAVLEQFYQKYAKDKVQRIPAIMKKYEGMYDKLESGLKKQYKDKAPNIQALYDKWKEEKKEELDILEQAASWDGLTDQQICIQIEKKRRKLDLSKCTPVTPETFKVWREQKLAEDKRIEDLKAAEEASKNKGKKAITGKALYQLDASIFQDDEEAMDEVVVPEDNPEFQEENAGNAEDGKGNGGEKKSADKVKGKGAEKAAAGAMVQDESLFLDDDDDLPSDCD